MEVVAKLRRAGVRALTVDSRRAAPEVAFVALPPATPASHDGRDFAHSALACGAPIVLGQGARPETVPEARWVELSDVRKDYPGIAAELAGEWGQNVSVFGVTGTDGKTSVAWLASELLSALSGGACARLGTLGVQWAGVDEQPGFTTLPAAALHPLLARMAGDGVRWLVMEVSSHALALGRVGAVRFRAGMLTTLARDHLDFHGDVERYHRCKLDWLDGLPSDAAIIAPKALVHRFKEPERVRSVGGSGVRIQLLTWQRGWSDVQLEWAGGAVATRTRLTGQLMLDNLAMACELARHAGFGWTQIAEAIPKVAPVPGRFEPVGAQSVVDYAHTPDALEQALRALRTQCSRRLIVVFGAGGDRDRGKRAEMAAAAERLADVVIVTTDNPRNEAPEMIIDEIAAGFRGAELPVDELSDAQAGWARVEDRRLAIERACALCAPGDLLLVAGKGAEQTQEVAGQFLPFDDRRVLHQVIGEEPC